ncbi:MAG TPA: PTS sugar transporter subunit IIA [Thermoanaerobaculia bacterium]|nr:PTS sugar transporter subunit IIA [Thermoanaerobaculia bacterium]
MPSLEALTEPQLIFPRLQGADAAAVLRELAERVAKGGSVRDPEALFERLWEREQLGSTGIGNGVAIPHCKLNALSRVLVAVGIAERGIDFGAVDDQPVRLFFLVVSPSKAPAEHLQSLAAISKWAKADHHVERILELQDPEAIYSLIQEEGR